jgi:hypothetical protein
MTPKDMDFMATGGRLDEGESPGAMQESDWRAADAVGHTGRCNVLKLCRGAAGVLAIDRAAGCQSYGERVLVFCALRLPCGEPAARRGAYVIA